MGAGSPGLRERKKQRTRETIVRAAFELFARNGYAHSTVTEIAIAAEVAPRTVFTHFPRKEDILFSPYDVLGDRLERALVRSAVEGSVLDTVRTFVLEEFVATEHEALRRQMVSVVAGDDLLAGQERARLGRFERLLADALAREREVDPDDPRVRAAAAALVAGLDALFRLHGRPGDPASDGGRTAERVDGVVAFVRRGLETI